ARRAGTLVFIVIWAVLSICLGFTAALVQTQSLEGRMLRFSVAETIEGRVVEVSRSASGAPRVILDCLLIYGLEAELTPRRVRISLAKEDDVPVPGQRLRVFGRLSAPEGPVEPGGYNFRRHAFFADLGAVGYALGTAVPLPRTDAGPDGLLIRLAMVRDRVSRHLRKVLTGPEGAFAAAIVVGDRAHIDEQDAEALRAANLSHLLAISGLHMGILTGLVFSVCRFVLALSGWLSLRYPVKKFAAVGALLVAIVYLGLSGATVATQRAFIMVAVALIAVLLDRQAITLRAVAVAAVIVLLIRPVSLFEPGFQMSFAATTVLVAGYAAVRDHWRRVQDDRTERARGTLVSKLMRMVAVYIGGLLFTSLLAGLATAPFAAFHFNRTAPYGLIANLVAVPVMGLVVAPSAIAAGVAAVVGLDAVFLAAMGAGIDAILDVAHWVATLPGAVGYVAAFDGWIIAVATLGGLSLVLLRGAMRFVGLPLCVIAAVLWFHPSTRPHVLVAPDAQIVGVLGSSGRTLDRSSSRRFIATSWLRRDGDPSSPFFHFSRSSS
ncbi:MAG: ComEC/Rec2 family competence protein, partial [Pseudomonadota bacterium]